VAVVHFVRECRNVPTDRPPPGVEVRLFDVREDHALVIRLAQAAATGPGPAPTPEGLLAELTSRPDRTVEAWLAADTVAAGPQPLGIAILVTGSGEAGPRHSISWLIVHPAAQRRGIGRCLVDEASRRADELGATEVFVECHSAWADAVAFWRSVGFIEPSRHPRTRLDEQSPG